MQKILLFIALFFTLSGYSQVYNRVIKVNSGLSTEQFDHKNVFEAINDTSVHNFEFVSWAPTISYSHELVVAEVLSFSGTIGFQYLNIYYDNQYYGSPYLYFSVNPHITLFHKKSFEYYMKLQAGLSVWFHNTELLTEQMTRLFPDKVNFFTGVTLGGFNFFISDHLGLNVELSIWSPEMATFGLSYRFFRGELPEIQENEEL